MISLNRKTYKTISTIVVVAIAALLIGNSALAIAGNGLVLPNSVNGTSSEDNAYELLETVTNWVLGIVGAVAVLFIIYGGFRYITSQGNQQQMDTAKNILIKAIIGLVIVVVAYVIVRIIVAALAGPTAGTT